MSEVHYELRYLDVTGQLTTKENAFEVEVVFCYRNEEEFIDYFETRHLAEKAVKRLNPTVEVVHVAKGN